jgi:hypothetical protein
VIGVYNDIVVTLEHDSYEAIHVVNGKATTEIFINPSRSLGDVEVDVYDTLGNLVRAERRSLTAGVHRFAVPAAGLVSIAVGSVEN